MLFGTYVIIQHNIFIEYSDSFLKSNVIYFLSKAQGDDAMDFIKDLYYGNISPATQRFLKDSEYIKLLKSSEPLREEIEQKLSDEDTHKLDILCETYSSLMSITAEDNYASGFRDGARLMIDILFGKNENLISCCLTSRIQKSFI